MPALRLSLFSKIMVWFFLNLLLLAAVLWLTTNFRFDSRSRFFGMSNRIEALTRQLESELNRLPKLERDRILENYSRNYAVEFYFFDFQGKQLAGRAVVLPDEVMRNVSQPEGGRARSNQPSEREPLPRELPPPRGSGPPPLSVYFRAGEPPRYWFVGRIMTVEPDGREPIRTRLIVASDSFTGRGLFFDPTPYAIVAATIVGLSILFWLPFVRRITGDIRQMTDVAESIAEENFAARVSERRTDELGRLGKSINHLAERLSGFVGGQKRFLGDISHELNSPLARMQFALSILEDRVDERNLGYVRDVREEVELMSKLVAELLSFAKAGIKTREIELQTIDLRALVEQAVERETIGEQAEIKNEISPDTRIFAHPELLRRAVANVVRNAVRYAGESGAITLQAARKNDKIQLTIADCGAGVPERELEKLFDPFYRLESDRARSTGGAGLGLAIVKSCVEACGGRVFAANRQPAGLEITFLLESAAE